MPGIATHFTILDLTIKRLETSGNPDLEAIAQTMKKTENAPYANLGAIGPTLGDFLSSGHVEDFNNDPNPYAFVWKNIFALMSGDPTRFPGSTAGLYFILTRLRLILDTMNQIAQAEDCDRLKAVRDGTDPNVSLSDIQSTAQDFANLLNDLNPSGTTIQNIATAITQGLMPNVDTAHPADPVPAPETWHPRNFLHWRNAGRFVHALVTTAKNTGDDRLLAYAYGYAVSYAANVSGNPFINSATGGPPRTQWWRTRFTKNFVDAWVWGYYNQDPRPTADDMPAPPYTAWPNLCNANLQQRIELGAMDPGQLLRDVHQNQDLPPGIVPDDFAQHWFQAFQTAYPGPHPEGIRADALNNAVQMLWLMLWFQTSGAIVGCNFNQPVAPPDGCATDPSTVDPFPSTPGGSINPPPSFDSDLEDKTAEVCGILLAILGGVLFLAGAAVEGAAAVAGAAALLDCSNVVHWDKLRCELYGYSMYLYLGLKGVNELLAFASLGYPYTEMLEVPEYTVQVLDGLAFESGPNLVKSRGSEKEYPSRPWDGSLVTLNQRPTAANPGFEKPGTVAYRTTAYPNFFVDDDVNNPLVNGDVKTDTGAPMPDGGRARVAAERPVQFGNAVANAVDLLGHMHAKLPDWNLDADRGLAYLNWLFDGHYDPNNVKLQPQP